MLPKKVLLPLAVSALLGALCGTALAGIEPVPFHVTVANRTNQLAPSSPFYSNRLHDITIVLTISNGQATTPVTFQFFADGQTAVMPGQVVSLALDPTTRDFPQGGQIESWTVRAGVDPSPFVPSTLGIDPVPFVFAYATRVSTPPVLQGPPDLPIAYLTSTMYLMAFASPGVEVGSVQMVADNLPTVACPVVPPAGEEWKSHGQYVRCVAQSSEALVSMGVITTEQADAIVAAAAQSEVGKK